MLSFFRFFIQAVCCKQAVRSGHLAALHPYFSFHTPFALKVAGCERTFEDAVSGAKADRIGLAAFMSVLRVACW